jgi:hypothetical protein
LPYQLEVSLREPFSSNQTNVAKNAPSPSLAINLQEKYKEQNKQMPIGLKKILTKKFKNIKTMQ